MAIKFETASGPQGKPSEKRAEPARSRVDHEDKKNVEVAADEGESGKASPRKIKQRSSFKKK